FISSDRTELQSAYFDFTKKLLNWRKGKKVVHQGKTLHFSPVDNVYVYFRYLSESPGDIVMVVMNNSKKDQTIVLDRFEEGIQGRRKAVDVISGKEYLLDQKLEVSAKTALIFELR